MPATVLVITPHPIVGGDSDPAGMELLRFYEGLAEQYGVIVVTPSESGPHERVVTHAPGLREVRVPKDERWRAAYASLALAGLTGDIAGSAFGLAVAAPGNRFREVVRAHAAEAALIVHESAYSEPIFSDGSFAAKEAYRAGRLAFDQLGASLAGRGFAAALRDGLRCERRLLERASAVYAATPEIARKLSLFHGVERSIPPVSAMTVPPPPCEGETLHGPGSADRPDGRPLVLAFNDYPVTGTGSGGRTRILNLLGGLDAAVVLLSFGAGAEAVLLAPALLQVTVRKTSEHIAFERAINAEGPLSVDDLTAALFAARNPALRELVAIFAPRARACVLEHPYMAPLLDLVADIDPGMPVVYSAHNLEARHRLEMLAGHPSEPALAGLVRELEAGLLRRADLVVACTEDDRRAFARWGADTVLAPNGCRPPILAPAAARGPDFARPPCVGFMGSAHPPNVEAARFILGVLAPALPHVAFELFGDVCSALDDDEEPGNARLLGVLDHPDTTETLRRWWLALNPVASGGGSSVKVPEFLAHGLPVIATARGARGYDLVGRDAGVIAERETFAAAIAGALADPGRLRRQAGNARAYAQESLTWTASARRYRQCMSVLLAPKHGKRVV